MSALPHINPTIADEHRQLAAALVDEALELARLCDYCGFRPASLTVEGRDDSTGYHEELNLCDVCAMRTRTSR